MAKRAGDDFAGPDRRYLGWPAISLLTRQAALVQVSEDLADLSVAIPSDDSTDFLPIFQRFNRSSNLFWPRVFQQADKQVDRCRSVAAVALPNAHHVYV